jgi:hypothetical protein
MNIESLLKRLWLVRNAEFNAHAQRMCVLGYLGAMLEMEKITYDEYNKILDLANNACQNRRMETCNAI